MAAETVSQWQAAAGGLTHGALPHQADELMRPRLPRHPQQDLPERAVGEPATLKNIHPAQRPAFHGPAWLIHCFLTPRSIFTFFARAGARARAGDGILRSGDSWTLSRIPDPLQEGPAHNVKV